MKLSVFKLIFLISFIIILAAISIFLIVQFLPHKFTGSFEYVRKGEEFLNKGRYPQAINYFEKAHESSPDNDTIRSELIYAYSTYADILAKENRYDEAIGYLAKSYNAAPSASTLQNLAFIYSDKALHEAKKKGGSAARIDYANARQYASQSNIVSRNLGIMLYNDGVNEFKSGRETTAIMSLKESSLVYKDAKTFELLGDLYYKRAELEMARYYWHDAVLLNPDNAELTEKMKKVVKEIKLAAREKEEEITHFEIKYTKDLPIDKELAARTLEKAYVDIGRDLGYFPDAKTKIFFYSKEDFKNTFNMPCFVKAFYDGSIKMPAPETHLDREKFADYIYHEYTHAIVSAKTNNNCPVWFSEGIAFWEESKKSRMNMEKLFNDMPLKSQISFGFLNESFQANEATGDSVLNYMIAYTLVDFILHNWGISGLQGVLKRLAKKQHILNAIDDEFLISEGEFEKRWRDYAAEKFFKNNS